MEAGGQSAVALSQVEGRRWTQPPERTSPNNCVPWKGTENRDSSCTYHRMVFCAPSQGATWHWVTVFRGPRELTVLVSSLAPGSYWPSGPGMQGSSRFSHRLQ